MSENDPDFVKKFRGLYDYIRELGEHIQKIQRQIEAIERNINVIKSAQAKLVYETKAELESIKENMVTKSDVKKYMETLEDLTRETLQTLPKMDGKF